MVIAVSGALLAMRSATAPLHAELESSLVLCAPGAGRAEYAAFVAALWGWMAPLEARLWRGPWPADAQAASRAVKSGWLLEDIRAAQADGLLPASIPVREGVEEFASLAQCAGWGYVIEGSTLGARVLSRSLAPALRGWPMRWLRGYGEEAGARWAHFLEVVNEHVSQPRDVHEAQNAARNAFASIGAWMRERGAA